MARTCVAALARAAVVVVLAALASGVEGFLPGSTFAGGLGPRGGQRALELARQAHPVSIVVEALIEETRIDEFLDVIEADAVGSRGEEGCLRFDVIRSQDDPCKFYFYEVYVDAEAVAVHKAQPHFKLWSDFKASGGVASSVSHKGDAIFFSG
uniref:ABM domain-containing protein n=1 Tax=Rhizochromulina marina TaxID=1034831 RepID=A0A7S2RH64_9STRA|mmetsp:Transcript_16279/g.47765  ORF Transcript_16279/g.47765 Transcript_16279/m.47765 type:complete len:153 (+) Transcript_16279:15-473(+)